MSKKGLQIRPAAPPPPPQWQAWAAHSPGASPAGAVRYDKCQFSGPLIKTPAPSFLHLKPFLGLPGTTLKIWRQSPRGEDKGGLGGLSSPNH